MTTPPTPPAVQAVSAAAHKAWIEEDHASSIAAAALIAAADRQRDLLPDVLRRRGFAAGIEAGAAFLEAIAAELRQEGRE